MGSLRQQSLQVKPSRTQAMLNCKKPHSSSNDNFRSAPKASPCPKIQNFTAEVKHVNSLEPNGVSHRFIYGSLPQYQCCPPHIKFLALEPCGVCSPTHSNGLQSIFNDTIDFDRFNRLNPSQRASSTYCCKIRITGERFEPLYKTYCR